MHMSNKHVAHMVHTQTTFAHDSLFHLPDNARSAAELQKVTTHNNTIHRPHKTQHRHILYFSIIPIDVYIHISILNIIRSSTKHNIIHGNYHWFLVLNMVMMVAVYTTLLPYSHIYLVHMGRMRNAVFMRTALCRFTAFTRCAIRKRHGYTIREEYNIVGTIRKHIIRKILKYFFFCVLFLLSCGMPL